MQVYLFGFSKRANSTKRPTLSDGVAFTMQLKEETSVQNPALIINKVNQQGQQQQPTIYNYAYIPSFMRYYFIRDWEYINGAWVCYCVVDVLASFKLEIGATSAYVERSASMYDSNVIDNFYPTKADADIVTTPFAQIFNLNTGCFVIGVIDCMNTDQRKGTVTYWALTETELNSLLRFLYSGAIYNMESISDISEGLYKCITDPGQYIVSCFWVPFSRDIIASGPLANITIGYWVTNAGGKIMNAMSLTTASRIVFPNHPQISRGAYLNFEPFSRYTLYFPPFGAIPIRSIFRTLGSYLNCRVSVDLVTGQGSLKVNVQSTNSEEVTSGLKVCAERNALVGVPIQMSRVNTDIWNGVSSLIGGISSAVSGNGAGAISGVMSGIQALAHTDLISTGFNGSFLECVEGGWKLVSEFYEQVDTDNADHGKPLMSTKTIATLSGYIKCSDGHFSGASCYDDERAKINAYMVDGFYYE